MSIMFNCACGQVISATDSEAGREVACPRCSRRVMVPTPPSGGEAIRIEKSQLGGAPPPSPPGQPPYAPPGGPQYGQAPAGAPPHMPPGGTPKTSGMAIASLVLGIASLVCCGPVVGILAIVFGAIALSSIRQNPRQLSGDGLAIGGIVLGALGIVGGIVGMAVMLSHGWFHRMM